MLCIKCAYRVKQYRVKKYIKKLSIKEQRTHFVPGHALHEKGLQRQISVVTLVSSQERRALFVPLINRG